MKSILDPTFKYTPAVETDIRKTFARVKRERKLAAQEAAEKVTLLPKPKVVAK